jgi:hypothetical protein
MMLRAAAVISPAVGFDLRIVLIDDPQIQRRQSPGPPRAAVRAAAARSVVLRSSAVSTAVVSGHAVCLGEAAFEHLPRAAVPRDRRRQMIRADRQERDATSGT